EVALDLVEIHLEAVDHVLADLGEDAGGRGHESDAQLFGGTRGRHQSEGEHASQEQRTRSFQQDVCHSSFLLILRELFSVVPCRFPACNRPCYWQNLQGGKSRL